MKPKQKQSLSLSVILQFCNAMALLATFFRTISHRFSKITPKIFNVQ